MNLFTFWLTSRMMSSPDGESSKTSPRNWWELLAMEPASTLTSRLCWDLNAMKTAGCWRSMTITNIKLFSTFLAQTSLKLFSCKARLTSATWDLELLVFQFFGKKIVFSFNSLQTWLQHQMLGSISHLFARKEKCLSTIGLPLLLWWWRVRYVLAHLNTIKINIFKGNWSFWWARMGWSPLRSA